MHNAKISAMTVYGVMVCIMATCAVTIGAMVADTLLTQITLVGFMEEGSVKGSVEGKERKRCREVCRRGRGRWR
jgi:hypothetical protein